MCVLKTLLSISLYNCYKNKKKKKLEIKTRTGTRHPDGIPFAFHLLGYI